MDHSLFPVIFVFFLFTHWDYIYYCRIVSFVFGVFPCHSFFSAVTRFGLMELEMEMQLSGYHGCWGCTITMVNGVKDSLQQVLVHGKISIIMAVDFVLHCYPHGLSYFRCIFHFRQS